MPLFLFRHCGENPSLRSGKVCHCEELKGILCSRKRDEAISKQSVGQFNAGDCFVAPPALARWLLAMTGFLLCLVFFEHFRGFLPDAVCQVLRLYHFHAAAAAEQQHNKLVIHHDIQPDAAFFFVVF